MHMMRKKDLSSKEMGPTVVLTANWKCTSTRSQVFVHDLNQLVTLQQLEETPAVLSLGELCEDHGSAVKSHD